MPPLSTIICTDCWTKSKGLYLLLLASAALCYRKMHFLFHFFSLLPPLHTPWYVYFDMKVGLCESAGCCKSLLISDLISLCCVRVCMHLCVNVLAPYYILENTSVFSIQLCVLFFSLFRVWFTWATDFPFPHLSHSVSLRLTVSVSFFVFVL